MHEYLPLYEDGPGNGTWNFNRYHLPRGSDVAVWAQTADVLPPLSDSEPPKGMAEVVMIPIMAAIVNGIAHAIGHRFRDLPVTPEQDPAGAGDELCRPARSRVTINGQRHGPIDVPEGMMMIDVLHEMLGLTGTRLGCGQGMCHACTVIGIGDDRTSEEVQTCITGAGFFDGKRIRTVEGIAQRNDEGEIVALSPVQQAFLDHFSFQCGYCTPGFVNAATVLMERLAKRRCRVDRSRRP